MSLEVEYRGYVIRYSENGDEWVCFDLDRKGSAPTLSKMKEKIDDFLLSIRKQSSVRCLELKLYRDIAAIDATIIEYIGPVIDGGAWSQKERRVVNHNVAASAQRDGSSRAARKESRLSDYAPISPETDRLIEEARRLAAVAEKAKRDFEAAVAAIPRLTIADIEGLVKVSGVDATGGIKEGKA